MSNLDWIRTIPDIDKHLSGDALSVFEALDKMGEQQLAAFAALYDYFGKSRVDFSDSHLNDLRKEYIRRHYDGANKKELARVLRVSLSFVNAALKGN